MTSGIAESVVESAALAWLEALGLLGAAWAGIVVEEFGAHRSESLIGRD